MQLATFYPNKITIKTHKKRDINDVYKHWMSEKTRFNSTSNLGKEKSNINLSSSSKRNIINSVNSLFYHSKARTIKLSSGKLIYNYRASFITLTLPSKQVHSDVEIKARLNVFLQVLRTKYDIKNYVWKAELQGNENIHFHLIIDKYINYGAIKYYWNKAIKSLGYIDEYAKKFDKMTLAHYIKLRAKNDENKIRMYYNNYVKAYYKGKSTNWREPNSVDVVSIRDTKSLSHYLAKYLTKDLTGHQAGGEGEDNIKRLCEFGKVWSRSTSLSKLKYKNRIDYEEIKELIIKLKAKKNCVIDKIYDYCRVIYLNLKNCPKWFVQIHKTILSSMARMDNYPFPT